MNAYTDDDAALRSRLEALDPDARQVGRVGRAVEARVEREATPILAEWVSLLRVRPLAHGGLLLAAACVLVLTTPLGSLLLAALRAQQ